MNDRVLRAALVALSLAGAAVSAYVLYAAGPTPDCSARLAAARRFRAPSTPSSSAFRWLPSGSSVIS